MSQSPSKSRLLLLDAGIIIELFRLGCWEPLIRRFDVILSRTVVEESFFYDDENGFRITIDLSPYEANGSIKVVDVLSSRLSNFLNRFDQSYRERLDEGELELLTYLSEHDLSYCRICSADGIVYRTLGKMRRSDQGVSLQELLVEVGHEKHLQKKFTKEFREVHTGIGFQDSFR